MKDFKKCYAVKPSSMFFFSYNVFIYSVRRKIDEVSKLVKKQRFEDAIHVEISTLADEIIFKELRSFSNVHFHF